MFVRATRGLDWLSRIAATINDVTLWGWAERPARRLVFASDVPKLPRPLPRALAPDVDRAVMAAVDGLDDPFARTGLTLLRRAGLRLGECLDLELDCVVDYGATGSWLRVPLGKLATERMVPLEPTTVELLDTWAGGRGRQRPSPTRGPVDRPASCSPSGATAWDRGGSAPP